jgi:hypothetical protein
MLSLEDEPIFLIQPRILGRYRANSETPKCVRSHGQIWRVRSLIISFS